MRILKIWMGKSASTGFGCDNGGYPKEKYTSIESVEELVETFDGTAKYYKLTEVDVVSLVGVYNVLNET